MIIDVKLEFGYESLFNTLRSIGYKQGELEKVITCKGMKPFITSVRTLRNDTMLD